AVMVETNKVPANLPKCAVVAVENTRKALGQVAARYRDDFSLPVVAVGGSNGKTTTKELLASVLRQKSPTLWSEASFNNDIGVPLRVEAPRADFSGEYRINLLGRHQVVNALLAMAVGAELGLSRAEIERGLAECQPPKMRMQLWETNGIRVLDDSYNANADSMLAALQTLQDMPC